MKNTFHSMASAILSTLNTLDQHLEPQGTEPPRGLTVARSAQRLGLTEDQTIDVLVNLRTWLHNAFFVPACRVDAMALDLPEDSIHQQLAVAALAKQLDDIDEVYARLDGRVVGRVPKHVPIVFREQRERDLMVASVGLGPHEAAWAVLRPEGLDGHARRIAPGSAADRLESDQLTLPFDGEDVRGAVDTMRRYRHRHRPRVCAVAGVAAPRQDEECVQRSVAIQPANAGRSSRVSRDHRPVHRQ